MHAPLCPKGQQLTAADITRSRQQLLRWRDGLRLNQNMGRIRVMKRYGMSGRRDVRFTPESGHVQCTR
jgi:hypothetical protein